MISKNKTFGALILGLATVANADPLNAINQGLSIITAITSNKQLAANTNGTDAVADAGLATLTNPAEETQIARPSDAKTRAVVDAVLPTVQQALSLHQCMKTPDSLRLLNRYAAPGVDMTRVTDLRWSIPNAKNAGMGVNLKYHDSNKCVSIRAIDQWAMPALNALTFRVVYFADDSGETVNFNFQYMKQDDGSWKISKLCSSYGCS